jgi:hypothetical protein
MLSSEGEHSEANAPELTRWHRDLASREPDTSVEFHRMNNLLVATAIAGPAATIWVNVGTSRQAVREPAPGHNLAGGR